VSLTPVLTVRDVGAAVDFYVRGLGASVVHRSGLVVEMAVAGARFRVGEEASAAGNLSPASLGGTTVRLNLLIDDPDALVAAAVASGAVEISPVADQPFGLRQGRIKDPFGHHWLIGRPLPGVGDWAVAGQPDE
jgi:PhnB protein